MSNFLKNILVGNKKYSLSHNGETVYCSSGTNKTGGREIKGVKFKNNQLLNKSGKSASDFEIASLIK